MNSSRPRALSSWPASAAARPFSQREPASRRTVRVRRRALPSGKTRRARSLPSEPVCWSTNSEGRRTPTARDTLEPPRSAACSLLLLVARAGRCQLGLCSAPSSSMARDGTSSRSRSNGSWDSCPPPRFFAKLVSGRSSSQYNRAYSVFRP